MSAWAVERRSGSASALHARDGWESDVPVVRLLEVDAAALVLGSTQPPDDVDAAAASELGVEVVRRASGGGAVLLVPGEHVWLDVIVPRDHPAWRDDITVAARWLGRSWAEALAPLDVAVHPRGLEGGDLGRVVCFSGTGPGEVLVDGAKLVGVSQARRRSGARFQSMVHHVVRPDLYERLLAPGLARVGALDAAVSGLATVSPALDGELLADRLAHALAASEPRAQD